MEPFDAPSEVHRLLTAARSRNASDLHIEPDGRGAHEARFRVDGVLIYAGKFPAEAGQMLVARLMVLAHLLTYRVDVPQEGRANWEGEDLRISVMPTAKGLRCAVRLPSSGGRILPLSELGLGGTAMAVLRDFVAARSGMLVVTGPAGSGKTTLSYALLTEILSTDGGISIVTLEDPVERMLPRVTQIEVTPFGQLTYERALRSMLRQDPQVLLLGEVRDPATAQLAAQAAMSGHRLICTLHADDPAAAIRRLLDMGVEPFQLTSSLRGVIALRLLRKRVADGYAGRTAIGEAVSVDAALREAIIKDDDASHLRDVYTSAKGHVTLREAARRQVDAGETDPLEVQRVLGT